MTENHNIFNIPASVSFTDTLAAGLLKDYTGHPNLLADILILLPTRRACRSLQDAFLRQSEGTAILLPKMKPFGDIDADELIISGQGTDNLSILPAMPKLKRQVLLAQIIGKLPNFNQNPAQNMALAQALGALMDEIYTENLDLSDLPTLVDRDAFAAHWQITLDFLDILSIHWPQILKEHGCIDIADRRNRLLLALNDSWQTKPPPHPIIAAGTTGSIPATTKLLKTISKLEKGSIILPGLDQFLPNQAWQEIEEGHPQTTLKNLLHELEVTRENVETWPHIKNNINRTREKIISYMMAPANHTNEWNNVKPQPNQKQDIEDSLKNCTRYDCETTQEEALIISLIMRETLETPNKTAVLITPDRVLSHRVSTIIKRWGINIDDSAGIPLNQTVIGQFINLSAQTLIDGIKPLSLLSLLKHQYCRNQKFDNFRSLLRQLEIKTLRGISPEKGFSPLLKKIENIDLNDKNIHDLLLHLEEIFTPSLNIFNQKNNFKNYLKSHIELLETLSTSKEKSGEDTLWQGEAGEVCAQLFSEILEYSNHLPAMNGSDYLEVLEQFMQGVTVRPAYGTHPRLQILGQLEARLIQADCVILSGLNEGTWPPDSGNDPWMSRPMREKFGLPLPERSITLAAHDFAQGSCAQNVYLTRSKRQDNTPSVPARWLQRLDTFLEALNIDPEIIKGQKFKHYASIIDKIEKTVPSERPAPTPPISSRPNQLSVTKIETWLKDPYAIYASQILKLRKLDPIEKNIDVAEHGTLIHDIMDQFIKKYPKHIPNNANDDFIQIAKNNIERIESDSHYWNFWKPRIVKMADWVIGNEKSWREVASVGKTEIQGSITLTDQLSTPFTITARADRVDLMNTGESAIIDYKSGGSYSIKKLQNSALPQLPLEGLIMSSGGFKNSGLPAKEVGALSYWKITGGKESGKVITLSNSENIKDSIEFAQTGLKNLITIFENEKTPYLAIPRLDQAPLYNDYEHLERVKEWAALGDNDSDGNYAGGLE